MIDDLVEREDQEVFWAVRERRACLVTLHRRDCPRWAWTDVGLAVALGRACCITRHRDECPRHLMGSLSLDQEPPDGRS